MSTAAINAFKKEIGNIKFRRGVVVFAPAQDYVDYQSAVTSDFNLYTPGIIKDTNVGGDPIEYGPDNNGRTFVKAFDMNLQWVLMQSGPPELQNLPAVANPSGDGLYIGITDGPFTPASAAQIKYSDIASLNKIEFLNASVSPTMELNFSREESGITNAVKGVIEVADLTKLYSEPILLA